MKIKDILAKGQPTLSFEVFPPKEESNFASVEKAALEIAKLNPSFMSVTYGAGCADAQIRAGLTDLADQLGCILIIFFYLAVFRNIAAKCQDILNSVCLNLAQDTVHLLTGRGDAGQM